MGESAACREDGGGDRRLPRSFYDVPCEVLARKLLGKVLCRRVDDDDDDKGRNDEDVTASRASSPSSSTVLRGRIVESEMYPGSADPASHSFGGKRTKRNGAMFMEPGTAYVYNIYGMYQCFNVSSAEAGGAVLIRALEPLHGVEQMRRRRAQQRRRATPTPANKKIQTSTASQPAKPAASALKATALCSGPAKLCAALAIRKADFDGADLTSAAARLWIEDTAAATRDVGDVVDAKRIGIDSAGKESVDKLYRFYEYRNSHVSVRDKAREKTLFPPADS